ncbi:MAG: hypothetical protein ACKVS8_13970 [Phycisphaerales bacterium]
MIRRFEFRLLCAMLATQAVSAVVAIASGMWSAAQGPPVARWMTATGMGAMTLSIGFAVVFVIVVFRRRARIAGRGHLLRWRMCVRCLHPLMRVKGEHICTECGWRCAAGEVAQTWRTEFGAGRPRPSPRLRKWLQELW